MPRKGENIYKRKDGRWEGRYALVREENGKIKYGYVYAHSYKACKQKLLVAKNDTPPNSFDSSMATDTFSELSTQWLATRKPQLKESSMGSILIWLVNGMRRVMV